MCFLREDAALRFMLAVNRLDDGEQGQEETTFMSGVIGNKISLEAWQ